MSELSASLPEAKDTELVPTQCAQQAGSPPVGKASGFVDRQKENIRRWGHSLNDSSI